MFQYELLLVEPAMVVKQLSQFLGLDIKYVDKRTGAGAGATAGAAAGAAAVERRWNSGSAGALTGNGTNGGSGPSGTASTMTVGGTSGQQVRNWMAVSLLVGGLVVLAVGAPSRVGAILAQSGSSRRSGALLAVSVVLWLLLVLAVRGGGLGHQKGRGNEVGGRRLNFHGDERYATSRDYDVHISGVSSSDLEFIKVFQERALPVIMASGSDPEYVGPAPAIRPPYARHTPATHSPCTHHPLAIHSPYEYTRLYSQSTIPPLGPQPHPQPRPHHPGTVSRRSSRGSTTSGTASYTSLLIMLLSPRTWARPSTTAGRTRRGTRSSHAGSVPSGTEVGATGPGSPHSDRERGRALPRAWQHDDKRRRQTEGAYRRRFLHTRTPPWLFNTQRAFRRTPNASRRLRNSQAWGLDLPCARTHAMTHARVLSSLVFGLRARIDTRRSSKEVLLSGTCTGRTNERVPSRGLWAFLHAPVASALDLREF